MGSRPESGRVEEFGRTVAEFEQIMPEVSRNSYGGWVRYRVLPLCDRISHLVSQLLLLPRSIRHGVQSELSQIS